MLTRRSLLSTTLAAFTRPAHQPSYRVGDLVKVLHLPPQVPCANPDLAEDFYRRRLSLGKICRVIYVDEKGRAELDVGEHVVPFVPGLIGCSISFEPECLALVDRG
jgi:hypothetical protein